MAALVRAAAAPPRSYSPQDPTERQRAFLDCTAREVLYGGAAGGGKSSALLMAALEHVHVPGYAALILRRTFADLSLPGAIMDRSHDWLRGSDAAWHGDKKRWTFPSGATLTFGYLDTAQDRYRYQGAELQCICFDELTQFPEAWYRYLLSRLRRLEGSPVPIRARAATNPGGIGHEWVRRRFIDADDDGRVFVPAQLSDNPHVDQAEYRAQLELLDDHTRKQLLEGLWVNDPSGLVYPFDDARNVADAAPDNLATYMLGIDFGVKDATAFTVLAWAPHDTTVWLVESYGRTGMSPSDAAEEVQALQKRYTFERIIGDVGGLGKGFAQEMTQRHNLPVEAAEKHNKRGYQSLMVGALQRGQIRVVRDTCTQLLDEWRELPWREDRTKESDGFDNHCFVAGTMVDTERGPVPIERIMEGDRVWTRGGLMAVTVATQTGIANTWSVYTESGRALVGTGNHPVWTQSGWKRLDSLTQDDTLSVWESTAIVSASRSTARRSGDTPTLSAESCACTSLHSAAGGCTVSFGSTMPATVFQLVMSSTTSMATRSITSRKTSHASSAASTHLSMLAIRKLSGAPGAALTLRASMPPSGIGATRVVPGIARMQSGQLRSSGPTRKCALCALRRSSQRSAQRCAAQSVLQSDGANPGSTMWNEAASNVVGRSWQTSTVSSRTARDRVLRVERMQSAAPVFNLSVAGIPEYFANGILVHNCADSALYGWRAAHAYIERPAPGPTLNRAAPTKDERRRHYEEQNKAPDRFWQRDGTGDFWRR